MSPYIYPGIKPTSKLYFDLQAMIAENGGRLKLAMTLEAEFTKSAWVRNKKRLHILRYSKWEDELVMSDFRLKEIAQMIGRSVISVNQRRHKIKHKLLSEFKNK